MLGVVGWFWHCAEIISIILGRLGKRIPMSKEDLRDDPSVKLVRIISSRGR